uniref:Low molecular weight phosphotyrosine protein phosphatase n=1 Tax=Roseihalotalea indica TaxID=2867963 RepID=A0AA49GPI7_9BACT|nr:low molecular weight phosphotyrosine protein phosphatase [Tunicatimonas sp. TK19036]
MIKVLFVCLGNICRSPMAESVFNGLLLKEGLEGQVTSDSAGTSDYHIGEPPDPRTMDIVEKYQLSNNHRGRQFIRADFQQFDYVLAMDRSNLANIKRVLSSEDIKDRVFLMRDFDDEAPGADVPDPYWSEADGFEQVYQIILRSCQDFIVYLKEKHPALTQ